MSDLHPAELHRLVREENHGRNGPPIRSEAYEALVAHPYSLSYFRKRFVRGLFDWCAMEVLKEITQSDPVPPEHRGRIFEAAADWRAFLQEFCIDREDCELDR